MAGPSEAKAHYKTTSCADSLYLETFVGGRFNPKSKRTQEKRSPETWHMAGPSEGKAHYKTTPSATSRRRGRGSRPPALVFDCLLFRLAWAGHV